MQMNLFIMIQNEWNIGSGLPESNRRQGAVPPHVLPLNYFPILLVFGACCRSCAYGEQCPLDLQSSPTLYRNKHALKLGIPYGFCPHLRRVKACWPQLAVPRYVKFSLSARLDLNQRPLHSKCNALPSCATNWQRKLGKTNGSAFENRTQLATD